MLGKDSRFEVVERPDLFRGIVAVKIIPVHGGEAVTAIPYCLWENRGPNEMSVWFRNKPAPWDASWCFPSDSVEVCFDGRVPESSADAYTPRLTWWDHKGTTEWVDRYFDKPARVSSVELYWFDDTGHGGCRLPQSWRTALSRTATAGSRSNTQGRLGVNRGPQFNRVDFLPVTTRGLRLEVRLQPKFSGGILQWKIAAAK